MDIETAKEIFTIRGHKVAPQSDLIDKHEFWYKGHFNMSTAEFIEACGNDEVLTNSDANQLLEQFCVKVGPRSNDDNMYWHYYPHQKVQILNTR
ncbi:hypothetical protein [Aeromonas hydrophila]|uniref:hypothetical protein n=1 Tax=Aeromonas hydrophila TaxID=644 RepID=UPI000F52A354|nr:hypothetical protein [Aeromonas hydrophila]RQM69745.1 hypothetical protein EHZ82_10165 [Aeromonas hydrophila]